jgi:hypothetical protein
MIPTTVTYGAVSLSYCSITDWRSETVYDSGNFQAAYIRHQVTVRAVEHRVNVSDFAERIQTIQRELNTPRQRLQIGFGTSSTADIGPAYQPGGDAWGGPRTLNLSVTDVKGGRTAFIDWTIEYHTTLESTIAAIIAGHRWSQSFEIDTAGNTTRTVEGVLETTTAGSLASVNPDLFREHVFPPLVAGFKRERMQFVIESSGRQLRYMIEDVQQYRAAPSPALRASMQYVATLQPGGMIEKQVTIELEGKKPQTGQAQDPDSQQNLLSTAWTMMTTRIDTTPNGDIIMAARVTEDAFRNKIGLEVISKGATGNQSSELVNADRWLFFRDIDPTDQTGVQQGEVCPYGTAMIRAVEAHLFDQSSEGNPASSASITKAGVEDVSCTDPATPVVAVKPGGSLPSGLVLSSDPNILSTEQGTENHYTQVVAVVRRTIDNRLIEIPLAKNDQASVVQQIGGPRVIETHEGFLRRRESPPVVADIPGLTIGATRRGVVLSSITQPMATEVSADGSHREYGMRYQVKILVPFNPDTSDFSTQAAGDYGTFNTFAASGGIAQPDNPMLSSAGTAQTDAKTGV